MVSLSKHVCRHQVRRGEGLIWPGRTLFNIKRWMFDSFWLLPVNNSCKNGSSLNFDNSYIFIFILHYLYYITLIILKPYIKIFIFVILIFCHKLLLLKKYVCFNTFLFFLLKNWEFIHLSFWKHSYVMFVVIYLLEERPESELNTSLCDFNLKCMKTLHSRRNILGKYQIQKNHFYFSKSIYWNVHVLNKCHLSNALDRLTLVMSPRPLHAFCLLNDPAWVFSRKKHFMAWIF